MGVFHVVPGLLATIVFCFLIDGVNYVTTIYQRISRWSFIPEHVCDVLWLPLTATFSGFVYAIEFLDNL